MRMVVKRTVGQAIAAADPRCRFDRTVFVLGHMRCGSTALSNILCSRDDVAGYGEAHIAYRGQWSLGLLQANLRKRGGWTNGASILFDKILHDRYDRDAPRAFYESRAIFLIREPVPSIRSIRRLFKKLDSPEYASDLAAANYYQTRLESLAQHWDRFLHNKRIGLTHRDLTSDPEASLALISQALRLTPPLANHYATRTGTKQGSGAGDPLASHLFSSIVSAEHSNSMADDAHPLDLTPDHIEALDARYAELVSRFVADR